MQELVIPELVKDNETGLTFETGNAEDLSEKIRKIGQRQNRK